jgi:hypothetical protein
VLCGTGAHGAYHAGVLRALKEAGVRIDLLAGHGIGAGSAALAAIDGGARLWDKDGLWRTPGTAAMYGWKGSIRIATWVGLALLVVLLTPLLFLVLGLIILPLGFLLEMLGADAGAALTATYSGWLQVAFAGERLPTIVPRLAMIVLALLVLTVLAGVALGQRGAPARRRAEGGWWWRILGAPLDAEPVRQRFAGTIWELIRGAATLERPSQATLAGRYAEVLTENLGQPGFHEIVLMATDLDARRDVVAALLAEPFRREFLAPRPRRDRSDVLDLTGIGRDHVLDVLAAALTPPLVCDPQLVAFAPDSFWRGETHRLCDRPGSVSRILEEVAIAGVTQVLVVSAVASVAAPHRLRAPRLDVRSRLGEFQAAAEATALHDALETAPLRFESVFVVSPAHNPVGPFDFSGAYDEASDRRQPLPELMERAYEDAYRQFIEPVVGASGEQLARAGYPSG